jgi:hypothetical protein
MNVFLHFAEFWEQDEKKTRPTVSNWQPGRLWSLYGGNQIAMEKMANGM